MTGQVKSFSEGLSATTDMIFNRHLPVVGAAGPRGGSTVECTGEEQLKD